MTLHPFVWLALGIFCLGAALLDDVWDMPPWVGIVLAAIGGYALNEAWHRLVALF